MTVKIVAGEHYGRLQAIEPAPRAGTRANCWRFVCECGAEVVRQACVVVARGNCKCGLRCPLGNKDRPTKHRIVPGDHFFDLEVLHLEDPARSRRTDYWVCKCACGNLHRVRGNNLVFHQVRSCGCWARRKRGRQPQHCKHRLAFQGQTLTLPEWSERLGIKVATLRRRLHAGLPVEKILFAGILTAPEQAQHFEHGGLRLTLHEWSARTGISYTALCARLRAGWDLARALSVPSQQVVDAAQRERHVAAAHRRWQKRRLKKTPGT